MRSTVVPAEELSALTQKLPLQLWSSPMASRVYGRTLNVVCFDRQGRPTGVWVCPLDGEAAPAVRRIFRLLPYASPWVDPALHPVDRHRVVASMTSMVMSHVESVELPMDPRFDEVAALLEAGADVVCRHTRMLDIDVGEDVGVEYRPTTRNHIRAAEKRHTVEMMPPESFEFARAIVGQPTAAMAARRRSGLVISRQNATLCLGAVDHDGVCRGQVFVLCSADTAILMHSWFDRTGTRGVPSLLVDAAIRRAASELKTPVFDFEGSVIPSIDRFMAGFGARATPYPHMRWQRRPGEPARPTELG